MAEALLQVKNLVTEFREPDNTYYPAIYGISFTINKGEILGIVGESGSGKSVTSKSIMRLLPPDGRITNGEILLNGKNLLQIPPSEMYNLRGKQIGMIFQDPMDALDPVYRCGDQIAEAIMLHEKINRKDAWVRALELLHTVGIPNPERYGRAFPHELSGGMCQRIMIAIALSCHPQLLIADEPTTALDVTVQAKILDILTDIREKYGTSIMIITHDFGIVAEVADRIAVMYAGQIVEEGSKEDIFKHPFHPYTKGLMLSIPRLKCKKGDLYSISGSVPGIGSMPKGCHFFGRCGVSCEKCRNISPEMFEVSPGHLVKCHKYDPKEGARGEQ